MKNEESTKVRYERLLSLRQVKEITGVSATTLWRWQRAGRFPLRRSLSNCRIAWLESEVLEWVRTRPSVRV